jgi:hypothetical protein
MDRPLLLVDIDGVLSVFGFDPQNRPEGEFVSVDGIVHLLSAAAGTELRALGEEFELVWCSGWEEKADEYLPLALGLPAGLPHVSFDAIEPPDGRHWKLAAIDAYAGPDRPLAWIDDGHDRTCEDWAQARPAPTLLVWTDPAVGLTAEHAAQLTAWARALTS